MKFGYMPHFGIDLRSEVEFARKHFDFVEITLKLNLDQYNDKYLEDLKSKLGNFEALGHLHWNIDLTKDDPETLQLVEDFINIFKDLGIDKITIHPSTNKKMIKEKIIEVNKKVLSRVDKYCGKNGIQLLLENSTHYPFNRADVLESLINNIKNLSLTLDTGHALLVSKRELERFLSFGKMINHIHLHNCIDGTDHLFFKEKENVNKMIDKINNSGYKETVTLEMFNQLKDDESEPVEAKERRERLLEQLEIIRK
ncbi:MAG: sugar phosphate isomerase/epimerase family protein [Candidatus Aenigmatarchaeota archaeon]